MFHMRALVVGLARSGRAAVAALARRAARSSPTTRRGLDVAGIAAEVHLGPWDDALLDGVEPRRQEPRRAERRAAGRGGPRPRHRGHLRDRARRPPAAEPDPRRHRHERQDDDDRAARRDVRRRRRPGRGRRQHRPAADEPRRRGRPEDAWVVCELSSLPARGRRHAAPADRGAAQPRARPPRPARHASRPTATRSCASSRTRARTTSPSSRAASPPIRGAARRVEFAGDDALPAEPSHPGRAQPRERGRGDRRRAGRRASRTTRSREALRTFPGVEHRIEEVAARSRASATSTTRRRRTWPRRCARSPRSPARASS